MYDAPIPMINYVLATITASVLAYATAMDITNNEIDGSATDNLPPISDSYAKEPEPEKIEQQVPEPTAPEAPAAPVEAVPLLLRLWDEGGGKAAKAPAGLTRNVGVNIAAIRVVFGGTT